MTPTLFGPAQLEALARATLPPVGEGHPVAVVEVLADETGAGVVAGFTKASRHGTWQFAGMYRHERRGNDQIGARLVFTS